MLAPRRPRAEQSICERAPRKARSSIEVGDQGPGLPDDLAKYLVGHSDEAPGTGGGLGLWIVRRLVADEDGEIQVIQESGFSTLIRVTWPFRENLSRSDRAKDSVGVEAIHAE